MCTVCSRVTVVQYIVYLLYSILIRIPSKLVKLDLEKVNSF